MSGFLREFLRLEAAGGFLLVGVAVLALILANSPLAWLHHGRLSTDVARAGLRAQDRQAAAAVDQ